MTRAVPTGRAGAELFEQNPVLGCHWHCSPTTQDELNGGQSRNNNKIIHTMKTFLRSLCVASLLLGAAAAASDEDSATVKKAPPEIQKAPADAQVITPEQREAKRKELKAKMEAQLKELRAKKAAGKLTEAETKKLENLEKREAKNKEKAEAKADHKADHKADTK